MLVSGDTYADIKEGSNAVQRKYYVCQWRFPCRTMTEPEPFCELWKYALFKLKAGSVVGRSGI